MAHPSSTPKVTATVKAKSVPLKITPQGKKGGDDDDDDGDGGSSSRKDHAVIGIEDGKVDTKESLNGLERISMQYGEVTPGNVELAQYEEKEWPSPFPSPNWVHGRPNPVEDQNPWIRYLKRDAAFRKAMDIANIPVEISPSHQDDTIQIVYSYSEYQRNVDMLLFKCDCPSSQDVCSHIIAAAMRKEHQREKIIKLVIVVEMKKRIREYMKKRKTTKLSASDISNICSKFMKIGEKDAVQILLEIIAGIIYRSSQTGKKYGSHIQSLMKLMKEDYFARPDHGMRDTNHMILKAFSVIDRFTMTIFAEEGAIVDSDAEALLNMQIGGYTYDVYYGLECIYSKVSHLIRSLFGTLMQTWSPYNSAGWLLLKNLAIRMLKDEVDFVSLHDTGSHHLNTVIRNCTSEHDGKRGDPIVISGYAVGFDYLDLPHKGPGKADIETIDEAVVFATLSRQIKSLPLMEDVHQHTSWDILYRQKYESMRHFLEEHDLGLNEEYTFITINKGGIIKVPSTRGPLDANGLCGKIVEAFENRDPRTFVAYGITLLARQKKIELLPPKVWHATINTIFSKKVSPDEGPVFVAECINLLPEMLVLPFFQAYFRNTAVMTNEVVRRMSVYMNESILKGHMTNLVYNKMLTLGLFYGLAVKEEWKKAIIVAKKSAKRIADAKLAEEAAKPKVDDTAEVKSPEKQIENTLDAKESSDVSQSEATAICHDEVADLSVTNVEEILPQAQQCHVGIEVTNEPSKTESPTCETIKAVVESVRGGPKETPWKATDDSLIERGKRLIDEIRRNEFGVGIIPSGINKTEEQMAADKEIMKVMEKQRQRVARSIKRLSEDLYNTRIHLQLELLQNADDNEYDGQSPEITFLLDYNAIVVLNNERGFTEKDVRSLCDIGASSKLGSNERKTGMFGIGFKSVFLITQSPHIFSNGYHFKFSSDTNMENNTQYIMPHWVDVQMSGSPFSFIHGRLSPAGGLAFYKMAANLIQKHGTLPNTILYLPLKEELKPTGWEQYYSEFQGIGHLHLAFLRRLTAITFVDVSKSVITALNKSVKRIQHFGIKLYGVKGMMLADVKKPEEPLPKSKDKDNNVKTQVTTLTTQKKNKDGNSTSHDIELFVLEYKFDLDATEKLCLDASKNERRDCVVTVGIPILNKKDKWPRFDIYNVLPIADYGLPFLVNADFMISTSRQSIIDHYPWNEILARKVGEAFSIMTYTIPRTYRDIKDIGVSVIRAIPEEYSGRGCFESCCAEIHKILKELEWVAVGCPEKLVNVPSKVFLPPEDTCLSTKQNHSNMMRATLPPLLLRDYCNVWYADVELENPMFRPTLIGIGCNDLCPAFLVNVLKDIRRKVDLSVPLASQPNLIQNFLSNIGILLCIMERMATPQEIDDIRRSLFLVDTRGMLMDIDDSTMFIRDATGLGSIELANVVGPELFDVVWDIDGYAHRVSSMLELMGCVELTENNLLSTLVINKARRLLKRRRRYGKDEILVHSRTILHMLARNHDKLDTLSEEDFEILSSMPILLENGKVSTLDCDDVRFCPNCDDPYNVPSMDMQLSLYFSMVRRFFSELGLPINYMSQDYLKGIKKDGDSDENSLSVRDLMSALNYLEVDTFITYRKEDINMCDRGGYRYPPLPSECDKAIIHCNDERIMDLSRVALVGCKNVIHDCYSPDFSQIAMAIQGLYNQCEDVKNPSNRGGKSKNKGGKGDKSKGGPETDKKVEPMNQEYITEQNHRIQKAYNLSIMMYRIIEQELMLHPDYVTATFGPTEHPQNLGRSLLYYQLRNIPWLPYKQAVLTESQKGTWTITWQPVAPIAVEDDVAYPFILFSRRDPLITNKLLSLQQNPDLLEVLEFICEEIRNNTGATEGKNEGQYSFNLFGQPNMEKFKICFAKDTFLKALKFDVGKIKTALCNLYAELHRQMQQGHSAASRIRVEFSYKQLVVVFPRPQAAIEMPLTYRANDPKLAIYRSIVDYNGPWVLAEIYSGEVHQLVEFWALLGVNEFASVEETMRILEAGQLDKTPRSVEQIFACVMHLYNTMDNATFVTTLWKKPCIPITAQHNHMFTFETHTEWDAIVPQDMKVVAPSTGLVALKSVEAKTMAILLPSSDMSGAYVVMRPLEASIQEGNVSKYSEKYLEKVGVTKHQLWARILTSLKVTDLCDHISLVPVGSPLIGRYQQPLGIYVLLILLPYIHQHMRHRMGNEYVTQCKRLLKILKRLDICFFFDEVNAEYRYNDGTKEIKGVQMVTEALVHCDSELTIRLYVTVYDPPENIGPYVNLLRDPQRVGEVGNLAELPRAFFGNLAKVLLADPDADPVIMNKRFIRSTEQVRFLAGFMSTVYDMIRLQPKKTVDVFVKSYNGGYPVICICNAIRTEVVEKNPEEASKPTDAGGLCADKITTKHDGRHKEDEANCLPHIEGYGSHIPTEDHCRDKVMDVLVYMFLMNNLALRLHSQEMDSLVKALGITSKEVGLITPVENTTMSAILDVTVLSSMTQTGSYSSKSMSLSGVTYSQTRSCADTEKAEFSQHTLDPLQLIGGETDDELTCNVEEDGEPIRIIKKVEGQYPKSVLEAAMRTSLNIKESVRVLAKSNPTEPRKFVLYKDGHSFNKQVNEPLPYLRIYKNHPFDHKTVYALVENINPLKYATTAIMTRKVEAGGELNKFLDTHRNTVVGILGEEYVYKVLQEMLHAAIAKKQLVLQWHNQMGEKGLAYDISISRPDGAKVYIEVKSSASAKRPDFKISHNQWIFAQREGANYEIFRLTGVGQQVANLVRIVNPYILWKDGVLAFSLSI